MLTPSTTTDGTTAVARAALLDAVVGADIWTIEDPDGNDNVIPVTVNGGGWDHAVVPMRGDSLVKGESLSPSFTLVILPQPPVSAET